MKYQQALLEWQRKYMQDMLDKCNHNIIAVSRATGLCRTHLYRFCDKLGVKIKYTRRPNKGNQAWQALGG